jgi:hypothetical protein
MTTRSRMEASKSSVICFRGHSLIVHAPEQVILMLLTLSHPVHGLLNKTDDAVFHLIRNMGTNFCLQADSTSKYAAVVTRPCDSQNALQLWLPVANDYLTKFQNSGSGWCMLQSNDETAVKGSTSTFMDSCCCTNSDFNLGATLPNVVVMRAHIARQDTTFCVDGSNSANALMMTCNGLIGQKWLVGV